MTEKTLGDYEVKIVSDCNDNTIMINLETNDFDEYLAHEAIGELALLLFGNEDNWRIVEAGPMLGNANLELDVLCDIGQLASEDTDVWAAVLDHYGDHYAEEAMDCLKNGDITIRGSWDEIISQWVELAEIPERAAYYIDASSLQRDLEIEGSYTKLDDGRVLEFIG